jgi:hypothetical protein
MMTSWTAKVSPKYFQHHFRIARSFNGTYFNDANAIKRDVLSSSRAFPRISVTISHARAKGVKTTMKLETCSILKFAFPCTPRRGALGEDIRSVVHFLALPGL